MKLPLIIDVRNGAIAKYPDAHLVIDAAGAEVLLVFPNDRTGHYENTQPIVDAVNNAGWRIDIENATRFPGQDGAPILLSVENKGGLQLVGEVHRGTDGRFWWASDYPGYEEGGRDIPSSGWTIVAWRQMPAPAPRLPTAGDLK